MERAQIGLIGLATMGQNLALNLADHGFPVLVYNRTAAVTRSFQAGPGSRPDMSATEDLDSFVALLDSPRRIIVMVKAGDPVDQTLNALLDRLEPGDVVVDGGNSHWRDTERRLARANERGVSLIGAGISGGEEGARHGPSIMPGGDPAGWPMVDEMLTAIAARTPSGEPCCAWIGTGGSGHFIKMVHNGIEYADMQSIAEAYHLLTASGMAAKEVASAFRRFNQGPLDSYLIEITAQILERLDDDGRPLVDKVLDSAGQKGTGKWTVDSALELGQPTTIIAEAVFARMMSARKEERMRAASLLRGPTAKVKVREEDVAAGLYASKIACYAQGFMLISAASDEYEWSLEPARIPPLWRAGCIIRARMLDDITAAFRGNPALTNLMLDDRLAADLESNQDGWRRTVAGAVESGIPVPAFSSALAFYDSYRSARLPANLIQAQRDLFGAHTYERIDRPRGEYIHTDW
ncbi:MAG: decarboxylating NADP(+)-dependent phosphogluconate dehydrogenase [Actinomycetota bacterium]